MRVEFDRFGATCLRGRAPEGTFIDLTTIEVGGSPLRFVPMSLPAGLHFYNDGGAVSSVSILGKTVITQSYERMVELLGLPGILHLMAVKKLAGGDYAMRGSRILGGAPEQSPVSRPRTMQEWLDAWGSPQLDLSRFPHTCPRCGDPAYIGFTTIECSKGCG